MGEEEELDRVWEGERERRWRRKDRKRKRRRRRRRSWSADAVMPVSVGVHPDPNAGPLLGRVLCRSEVSCSMSQAWGRSRAWDWRLLALACVGEVRYGALELFIRAGEGRVAPQLPWPRGRGRGRGLRLWPAPDPLLVFSRSAPDPLPVLGLTFGVLPDDGGWGVSLGGAVQGHRLAVDAVLVLRLDHKLGRNCREGHPGPRVRGAPSPEPRPHL